MTHFLLEIKMDRSIQKNYLYKFSISRNHCGLIQIIRQIFQFLFTKCKKIVNFAFFKRIFVTEDVRMYEDEIYVTCVCGALVNEKDMSKHIEDCLKEDFIKNAVSLKISRSCGRKKEPFKERRLSAKCMRCGYPMYKDEGTLVTFHPSRQSDFINGCSYKCKSDFSKRTNESVCKMCKLPSEFHEDSTETTKTTVSCIENTECDSNNLKQTKRRLKCREQEDTLLQLVENISERSNAKDSEDVSEHEHSAVYDEIPNGPPCKLFHLALLPNYSNVEEEGAVWQNYSLLLQIFDTLPAGTSVDTQTDLPSSRDVGIQAQILGVYPEGVMNIINTGKKDYDIPNFDSSAEAAFQHHLENLIPCSYCSRTFSPDRIQKHMSCCIERPKSRQYESPKGGEIKR